MRNIDSTMRLVRRFTIATAILLAINTLAIIKCAPAESDLNQNDSSNSVIPQVLPKSTQFVSDEQVKIRESSEPINYRREPRDAEIVHDSQIVRISLDISSSSGSSSSSTNDAHKKLNSPSISETTNELTSNNKVDKQSQEFEVSAVGSTSKAPTSTTAASNTGSGSTWTFTNEPSSTVKPESTSNVPNLLQTSTTLPPATTQPATGEPLVASKTVREGNAVLCGEANANGQSERKLLNDRIVGGRKSEPGEFPFQVRLNIRSRRGSGICGGIILDEYHILTAAHCMTACVSHYLTTTTIETTEVLATIGDHSIRASDGEQEIEIARITPHEKYDACNFYANDHDIAILRTATKINFRFTGDGYGSINRPCLPTNASTSYREGESVIVSGWGVTRESTGALSNILRYVKLPVVNTSRCQEIYSTRVTDSHVCAGFQAGGKDSCQGDSGGPLVRVKDDKYELVGIVSFGYGCAQPGAFGVYTRIASYLDWISGNL